MEYYCKRCDRMRDAEHFYFTKKNRRQSMCKDCHRAYYEARKYIPEKAKEDAERHARYYEAHKEQHKQYYIEKYKDPVEKEKQRQREKRWNETHKEQVAEKSKEWYAENRAEIAPRRRIYDKEQWKNNPEVRARKSRQKLESLARQKNTPEFRYRRRWWSFNHNSRNRIRMYREPLPYEYISFEAWDALFQSWTGICPCCHEPKDMTVDHVIPISNGGYNVDENIQGLCRGCNTRKRRNETDYRK